MSDRPHRPSADVVVPFAGSAAALHAAVERLAALRLAPGDTLVVADNRREGAALGAPGVRIVDAGAQPGSYFARNRGAEAGANPWIVFLDADVEPSPGLLDAYLAVEVPDACGLIGGAVTDEPPAEAGRPTAAVRFAHARSMMSQDRTLERPEWAYYQTANVAVRRSAFEAVGGFEEGIRSGGDADLCFRLRAAGWTLERRDDARVVHRSRETLPALLRQRVRVGAGSRWLEDSYPGFSPRRPLARAVAGGLRQSAVGLAGLARGGGDEALVRAVGGLADAAFQVGWRLPNRAGGRR